MKRILTMAVALLLLAAPAPAKKSEKKGPRIEFARDKVDVGNIPADGGDVHFSYPFTNTGDEPLVIINVTNGGCGCTKPGFPQKPVAPGQTDSITINFNPKGRQGELKRSVTVRTNSRERSSRRLTFTGVVVPQKKSK